MTLSPRLKWKINRYSQHFHGRMEKFRAFFKSVSSQQKMCPACRALVDRREKVCPFCHERMSNRYAAAPGTAASNVLPEQGRYTILLLSSNFVLFIFTWLASPNHGGGQLDFSSLMGSVDNYTLVRFGAKYGPLIAAGQWWRFIAPVFLHANLLHIGMNSWVLYDLGPAVEGLYGRQKFLVLYLVSGAFGYVLSDIWYPDVVSIGASGAIFGLIGAMITYGYRNRHSVADPVRNMFVRWAIYGLLYGFLIPGLDNAAHIGGLAAGMVFGLLVSDMPAMTTTSIAVWRMLQNVMVVLIFFSFIMVALHPLQ